MLLIKSLSCDVLAIYLAITVLEKFTNGSAAVLLFLMYAMLVFLMFLECGTRLFSAYYRLKMEGLLF